MEIYNNINSHFEPTTLSFSVLRFTKLWMNKDSFKGSCTGNGIISGKSWAIYKNFSDKINLHTKLYISPIYKKFVSWRICLKRHSTTFFCGNSLLSTTLAVFLLTASVLYVVCIVKNTSNFQVRIIVVGVIFEKTL